MSTFATPTALATSVRRDVPAVEVKNLRKEFRRRDRSAGRFARRRRMPALAGRHVHDRARRVRRDPRPERIGQVDACPPALDPADQRRRRGPHLRPRRVPRHARSSAGSSTASRSRRASSRRCPRPRTSRTRRASTACRRRVTRTAIPEILEKVGFPADRRGESMENLSRGMQQKVALARALLTSPVLLLLDEPTTGLDPRSKLEVQEFIREVRVDARRDDPPLHARHGRGGGARRPGRAARPRRAAVPRAGSRREAPLRRADARRGVLRRHRAHLRGGDDEDDEYREVFG